MKLKTVKLLILPVLMLAVMAKSCGDKTTLDRVGAVVVAVVGAYGNELDQLGSQGLLDAAKHQAMKEKQAAIKQKAEDFARLISGFAEIKKGDTSGIFQQISGLTGLVDDSLTDPAIKGLSQESRAIKALRYVRATLDAASIAVAAIFPPSTGPVTASRSITVDVGRAPRSIVVNLPKK